MVKITYIQPDGSSQTVDATAGMTVMETAKKHMIDGIEAECGGACACATCHVEVCANWVPKLHPARDDEEAMLDEVPVLTPTSRLSCQIIYTPDLNGLSVKLVPQA